MKKLINRPEDFVPEMLDGLVKAHPDAARLRRRAGGDRARRRAGAGQGGARHRRRLRPSAGVPRLCRPRAAGRLRRRRRVQPRRAADTMLNVTRRIHGGKGVVYIYGNYGGDVMNFDMAAEMAGMEDIEVRTVLVRDDVASAPPAEAARRRGVAGMVFAFKVAGAKADAGGSLDEVAARRRARARQSAHHGRRAVALHGAARRQADLHHRRGRDGDRHGHPRRARRRSASSWRPPTRWPSRMAEAILADLGAAARRPRGGDGQRARRHTGRKSSTSSTAACTICWPDGASACIAPMSASTRPRWRWPARR